MKLLIYMGIMAITTYLIRMIPFTLIRKRINSRFIRSFLYYVPYAVLSAMTFPAIFYSTGNTVSAFFGTVTALLLALKKKPLIVVSLVAATVSFVVALIMKFV